MIRKVLCNFTQFLYIRSCYDFSSPFYTVFDPFFLLLGSTMRKEKRNENFYIDYHTKKLEADRQYKSYLKWCYKKGEVPMNKKE